MDRAQNLWMSGHPVTASDAQEGDEATNSVDRSGVCTLLHAVFLALETAELKVIYPDPGFPAYETTIEWSGATPVPLRLDEASGFRFQHARRSER